MSGGDDKKKSKKQNEPTTPAQATYQQSAFLPGWDNSIAQQLAAGGYGDANSLMAAFAPIFTPMAIPDYRPGATPTTPTPTPTTPTPTTPTQQGRQPRQYVHKYNGGRDG